MSDALSPCSCQPHKKQVSNCNETGYENPRGDQSFDQSECAATMLRARALSLPIVIHEHPCFHSTLRSGIALPGDACGRLGPRSL